MRFLSLCGVALFLSACSGAQRQMPEPVASQEASCPAFDTVVPEALCADLPADFGLSRSAPVEWGLSAATGNRVGHRPIPNSALYYGRLTCADGTDPIIHVRYTDSEAPHPSSSPRSSAPRLDEESSDLLDYWKVQCGDRLIDMYSNIYRCGSPCVPAPFRLIPAEAWEAYVEGSREFPDGDLQAGLEAYGRAVSAYPQSERLQEAYVLATVIVERYEEALDRAEAALELLPRATMIDLLRTEALIRLGRLEEGEESLERLFLRLPPDDRNQGMAWCYRSFLLDAQGKESESNHVRSMACEMGAKSCCMEEEEAEDVPYARR